MSRAPLRFLLTVLALWIGIRTAILLPDGSAGLALLPEAAAEAPPRLPATPVPPLPVPPAAIRAPAAAGQVFRPAIALPAAPPTIRPAASAPAPVALPDQGIAPVPHMTPPGPPALMPPAPRAALARDSRRSLSAWLLVRDESGTAALAPGGSLGGSQAGARLSYALGGGLSLSARAYVPLRRPAGAELAGGLDWQPVAAVPVHLLAERRQRLGSAGRSAFALTTYGGISKSLGPRLRLDAYGQAGVVGLRARDLFADGEVRLARRIGAVELGAGAWGAVQPGAARLDAGPSLTWRPPMPTTHFRLQADWRFRLAGDAAPGSGPALTLAADF